MLRTDKLHQFADTELADTKVVTFTHRPYIPLGCDQQGRIPEAAHAASEIDDWQPMPTRNAVVFWLALLGVPALVVALGLWMALA
jgi:hypothetical protein